MEKKFLLVVFCWYILTFSVIFCSPTTPYQALTVVPVADLLGNSLKVMGAGNISQSYQTLPVDDRAKGNATLRIHQVVFNERVEIIDHKEDEVHVRIPNVFYQNQQHTTAQNSFWALKKNFIPLSRLRAHAIDVSKIPLPIDFAHPEAYNTQPIVTLAFPFNDAQTQRVFSAGTRFVYEPTKSNASAYHVYMLTTDQKKLLLVPIPAHLCIANDELKTPQEKVERFVELIQSWAHLNDGVIPYVWGGCSLTTYIPHLTFEEKTATFYGNKLSYFELRNYNQSIKTGFDCAGMVSRAAQVCGMPYFFKNTATLARFLKPITATAHVKNGDLIWIPGHVLVVSNRAHNMIIEARSYAHGYGKIQEIPLHKTFHGIHTFDQLEYAFFNHIPLRRLDSKGNIIAQIGDIQLLNIASIWNT